MGRDGDDSDARARTAPFTHAFPQVRSSLPPLDPGIFHLLDVTSGKRALIHGAVLMDDLVGREEMIQGEQWERGEQNERAKGNRGVSEGTHAKANTSHQQVQDTDRERKRILPHEVREVHSQPPSPDE